MVPVDRKFSCFLIGRESFLAPCAQSLLDCGHQIFGIISTGTLIRKANSQGIPVIEPTADVFDFLSQRSFDYLFSISNLSILSQEILDLPLQFAINCHDGLLPKYGGMNAPSWAILNQEQIHGITWHKITTLVDGGDILKRISFEIESDETGATLNSKYYELIISSFRQLIQEIATNRLSSTTKNLQKRSYFSVSKRSTPCWILDWNNSAQSIDATSRVDLGHFDNLLGLPKLTIADEIAMVTQSEILARPSQLLLGTIVESETDSLNVATTSHYLKISEVQTVDGKPLTISELVNKLNLKIGDIPGGSHQFTDIDSEVAKQIDRIEIGLVKHESFWVKRLATLIPLADPFPWRIGTSLAKDRERFKLERQDWTISPMINDFLIHYRPTWTLADFLVAAVVAYLSRIAQQNCFDIALKYADLDSQLAGIPSLFADRVPCRIEIDPARDFVAAFEAIDREIAVVKQHQTYARDIVLRYPELRACSPLGFVDRLPVGIDRVKSLPDALAQRLDRTSTSTHDLTFTISDSGDNCYCDYNAEILDENTINRMLEQLTVFIDGIVSDPDCAIASLPLLSDVEHQILLKWNDTQVDFCTEGCIHQLFESQVAQTPDALAIVSEREQLTYRDSSSFPNDKLDIYLWA